MIRKPSVAGKFYPSSPSKLTEQVKGYVREHAVKEHAIGIVSPHAGLIYSGAVAGAVYSRIKFPRTFILLGPNHAGLGSPVSIITSGSWQMPTGELMIDEDIAVRITENSRTVEADSLAHLMEHSLEVQLPFILYYSSDVRIVPITMMSEALDVCSSVGESIANVVKSSRIPVTIVASSDMSHYVSDATAHAKDRKAIERVLALDPEGLYSTVRKEGISMCGFMPVTTMLFAARELGAQRAELVKYMTSGEVSGDYDSVVGYAGIVIH